MNKARQSDPAGLLLCTEVHRVQVRDCYGIVTIKRKPAQAVAQ